MTGWGLSTYVGLSHSGDDWPDLKANVRAADRFPTQPKVGAMKYLESRRTPAHRRSCPTRTISALLLLICTAVPASAQKPRARELGIPFEGTPGALNAITDVTGVEVGHATIVRGSGPVVIGEGRCAPESPPYGHAAARCPTRSTRLGSP